MIKLDLKDKKILSCLLKDCRQTDTQIAKICNLSREVVNYRINTLKRAGIIIGYTSDINFNNLSYIAYSLGLVLKKIPNNKIEQLKKRERIVYLQKTLGKFNLTCTILIKNLNELQNEYNYILSLFGEEIIEINSDIFLGDIDFSANVFFPQNIEFNFLSKKVYDITDYEKRILRELVKDSRQTIVKLYKKLKISVPTITKLIKELKNKNILLANRIILDYKKLGQHKYTLMIFADPQIEKQLIQYCRQNKNIWDIGKYSGSFNYIIEILASDNEEFESIVNSIKDLFSDKIFRMEIMIVSSELKHEYNII